MSQIVMIRKKVQSLKNNDTVLSGEFNKCEMLKKFACSNTFTLKFSQGTLECFHYENKIVPTVNCCMLCYSLVGA